MNDRITETGYGYISREVICDKSITAGAKAVYAYLCAFAGKKGICYPSRDRMADELKLSKRKLSDYIKELTDKHYIYIDMERCGGRFARTVYAITHVCKNVYKNVYGKTRRETFDEDDTYRDESENAGGYDVNEYEAYRYGDVVAGGYDGVSSPMSVDDDNYEISDADGFTTDGSATHGSATHGSATRGSAAHGSAAHGSAARGSAAHGSAARGSAAHGSTACGSTAHGYTATGIYKYNNNKNNTKKNNTFKNNTFKNNTFKNNSDFVLLNNSASKSKQDLIDFLSEYPEGALKNALTAFIEMRKDMERPVTPKAFKMIIKQLNGLSCDEDEQVKILEQSVINSWVSIYPLRTQNKTNKSEGNIFLRYVENSQ